MTGTTQKERIVDALFARGWEVARSEVLVIVLLAVACSPGRSRGDALSVAQQAPVPSGGAITDVVDVEVGSPIYSHAGCLLQRTGAVACWAGPNILLAFDRGRTEPLPGPWRVRGLDDAVALFHTGRGHCAIRRGGTGLCWSGDQQHTLEIDELVAITGTGDYLCVLRKDRTVQCSGNNYNGELGRPPVRDGVPGGVRQGSWAPVPGVTDIVSIAGTCAIRADGKLLCWGAHMLRTVHDWRDTRAFLATLVPQVITGIPAVKGLAHAGKYTCLLTRTGGVQCATRKEPDQALTWTTLALADVEQIAEGLGGVVARTRSGQVYFWGPGPARNVVDGAEWDRRERTAFSTTSLQRVPGIEGATTVSASSSHVCVATRDHRAMCWGHNEYGQLGNGTLAEAGATYVVDFHPALLAGPGERTFGCKPSIEIRSSCPAMGPSCALDAPPGYWRWGENRGVLCDDVCMQRAMDEVNRRPIPACMCTCSAEYQQLQATESARQEPPAP